MDGLPLALVLLSMTSALWLMIAPVASSRSGDHRTLTPALILTFIPAFIALIIENAERGNLSLMEYLVLATGLALIAGGGFLALRRHSARPIRWGILPGVSLVVLALILPFIGARVALDRELTDADTATPGATLTTQEIAVDVYRQVIDAVADETGYAPSLISERLDSGDASVAEMVRETGGDVETVVQGITDVMNAALEDMAAAGRMDANQAAFAISAMETLVRAGVEFDLTNLMSRFEETVTFDE